MMDQPETIENLRASLEALQKESARTVKVQEVLYKIAEAASASEDLPHFYSSLHALVGELMYAGNFFIAVLDEQTELISWPYHVDEKDVSAEVWEPERFEKDRTATSYVIRTGRSLHAATHLVPLVESGEIRVIGTPSEDAIFAPLRTGSSVLGALAVQSYTKGIGYTEEDVQVLTFVASHIATALTRARAIEETRRRNAELAIINSVGEAMARTLDVKTMTRIVGDKVLEIFGCDIVGILLLDSRTNLIHTAYNFDKGEGGYVDYLEPFPLGLGLTSKVIQSRAGLRIGTSAEQTAQGGYIAPEVVEHATAAIADSWLGVPIIVGESVLGVVSIGNYAAHAFDADHERLLQTLSTNMGVAIENARRFEAEQQRAAELTIINSIQEALAAKVDISGIYEAVGERISQIFPRADVGLRIYEAETGLVHFPYVIERSRRIEIKPIPLGPGVTRHVFETRAPLLINSNLLEKCAALGAQTMPGTEAEKSGLWVPIMIGNEPRGLVELLDLDRENAFSEGDVRLLSTIASAMSVALENARLFDELQQSNKEVTEALEQQTATNEVLRALSGSRTDLKGLLEIIAVNAAKVCAADDAHIYRVEGQTLKEWTHRGPIPGLEEGEWLPLDRRSVSGRAVLDREIIHVRDAAVDLDEEEYAVSAALQRRWGTRTTLSVPLLQESKSIGVIAIRRKVVQPFSPREIASLKAFADQAVIAIENARLFDETRRLLQETEQRNAELAIVNGVQAALATQIDLQGIFEVVGEKIHDIFSANAVVLATFDVGNDVMHRRYSIEAGERQYLDPHPIPKLWRWFVERGESLLIRTDNEAFVRQIDPEHKVPAGKMPKSGLSVPLKHQGQVRGVISLQDVERENAFGESDQRLLETLASSMSVALENARLFDETQRLFKAEQQRAAQLAIINSVQAGLAQELSLQAIYDLVGDKLLEIFRVDTVSILSYDAKVGDLTDRYAYEKGDRTVVSGSIPLFGFRKHVVETRQSMVINRDVLGLARQYSNPILHGVSAKSCLFTPMLVGERVTGVVSLQDMGREDAFTDADVSLLETLTAAMSVALENARLFDETQRLLKETDQRAAELAIINSVQEGLASKLELQAIYDLVGEKIRDVFDAQAVTINTYDFESRQKFYHYNFEKGQRFGFAARPFNSFDAFFIESGETYLGSDSRAAVASRWPDVVPVQGELPQSFLCAPLKHQGRVAGYISLQNMDRVNAFSAADVRLLETLTNSMSVALENARLFDETQRLLKETEQRAAELAIINSVQEGLASKLEMQAIYDLVGNKIHETFPGAQEVGIITYDRSGNLLHPRFALEKGRRYDIPAWTPIGFRKHVIDSRRTMVINREAERLAAEYNNPLVVGERAKSYLFVPLTSGDEVTGIVELQHIDREDAFSQADVRLLETLANSMSVALENARLFDETQRLLKETEQRAAELAIINSVQQGLASALEMQSIYDLVGEKIREIFQADTAYVAILNAEGTRFDFPYYVDAGKRLAGTLDMGRGLTSEIFQARKPLLLVTKQEASSHHSVHDAYADPSEDLNETFLGVPIILGDKATGVVSVQSHQPGAYGDSDVRLLQTLASSMSVALENARLFNETQRLLKETDQRAAELAIINSVQQALASKLEIQGIYDLVGDKIREVFDAQSVLIEAFDQTRETREAPYIYENGKRFENLTGRPFNALVRTLIASRQPVVINENALEESSKYGLITVPGTELPLSMVFVPYGTAQQVNGYFSLQNLDRENAFPESDVRLLQTLAGSMGIALENARLFDETQRLLKETDQRAAELAIINSVQEALASKLDMQAIYDLVGDKIRDIFGAQSILITTIDEAAELRHFRYVHERGQRLQIESLALNASARRMLRERKTLLINENAAEELANYGMQTLPGTESTRSGVWVPLLAAGRVFGVISLQNVDRENAFSASDVRLLETLASSMSVALENARLFDETQRLLRETDQRAAELAIINSVQEALASKLEYQAVIDLVGDKLRELFKTDNMSIRLYDPATNMVTYPYNVDGGLREPLEPRPLKEGFTAHIVRTREPLVINRELEQRMQELGSLWIGSMQAGNDRSFMGMPILAADRVIGVVTLASKQEDAFSEADARLLRTITNSMGVALENARLFDETQRLLKETDQRAAELQIINSVQEALASKLEMQAIYDLVGDRIREVFDAQVVLIQAFDHERQVRRSPYMVEKGQRVGGAQDLPFSPLARHLIATRQPVVINENAETVMQGYGLTLVPGTDSARSLVFVPFGTAQQVNGFFSLQNVDHENAFSESDVRLLQTLAGGMGIALENARLFEAERKRSVELAAINRVSEALVAEPDLDRLLQLIGEQLHGIFNPDIAYVALLNHETGMLEFRYQHGDEMAPMPLGQGLTSKMIESRQPLLINRDIAKRRQELGTQRVGKQAASYLGVPIVAGGEAIGAISVQSVSIENAFTEDDVRLLGTIAANAGAAIQTARLHTETRRRAQEMATLAEIGNDIAGTRDLDPVLERIAEHALSIMRVRDIAISLQDEDDGEAFHTRVALGRYADEMRQLVITPGRGILGHVLTSGSPEIVNNPDTDPRKVTVPGTPEVEEEPECLMAAPLISRGKVIGGLIVWRLRKEGLFSQAELDFLVSVARQTTIAIESARLYLETKRRANEMSALAEVGREISASLDSAEILTRIAERAQDLLQAETSAVYLMDATRKHLQAIVALGESADAIRADTITVGQGIIGTLAQQAGAEVIRDTIHDPRAIQIPGTNQDVETERMMAAPLMRGDEVVGMLAVWRTTAPFKQPDLDFLIGLSRQAAIAYENARLFDEVKRQGAYLETIFNNSPVAIVTVDDRDRVLSWNPAAEKLFGYSSAEANGRNVDDLVANSPEVREEAVSYTMQGKQNQYVHRVTRRTRKDGSLVDVDLSALPLPLEGGKTGVIAIYNDVGEIQRQRKYYEAIVQNSPVAIVTVDQESKVASWNPGAEQLFGYARDEAIGRDIDDLVARTAEIHTEAETYNDQARQRDLHVITKRTRKDSTLVDVELAGVPLPLPSGAQGLVAIYHDITELQRARQEAVAANEAKSAFLATMSHEIRTPMNAVIGMSGLLMDTDLSHEQRDYAETIRNSGDSLLTIINDILDFSKIEAGKMELESQPFDLRECVETAVDLVAARANEKQLDLAYIIEDDVPVGIRGDVTRLRQILLNLVSNAVKFTEKGEVVLTVGRGTQPEQLLFGVRDSGIGIPRNRMGRLFASFSQADSSTTRRFGGTGLGLAISRRLAEMMGGLMWAESAGPGKGSTFSFTIQAPAVKVTPRKAVRELNGIQPALNGKRVLIVDDNATNRRILTLQTAKWGMTPRDVASSLEALRLLRGEAAFDAAILDVQMPKMDGVTLAREVRKLKKRAGLPIILLTSLGRKEAGAEDLDIAAFLTKPLKPSGLFDSLVGIFGQHAAAPRARSERAVIDAGFAAQHPLRILLAEDNAVNQKLALRLLEQMGYRADVASNGIEAIESVQRQGYDVVLMDVQMPEMDGLDSTRAIRKLDGLAQPRIIAMTANAMQGDREMCIAAGMDDYVSKPIRVAELIEALRRVHTRERKVRASRKAASTRGYEATATQRKLPSAKPTSRSIGPAGRPRPAAKEKVRTKPRRAGRGR